MRYALVVWDFDGTLADTLAGILQIFNDLAPQLGYAPITEVEKVRDATPAQLLRSHGISLWTLSTVRNAVVARQKTEMASVRLYPGVAEALGRISRDGCRQGIVSSNSEENIRVCLRANAVEPWFEFVVGYSRLLGKQRALRRVLRRTALDCRDVLYVGDEVRDIAAAQEVGVDVAAVTWGINSKSVLAEHSPTHVIEQPCQLSEILEA
jgi:phosphoglycolate phosphatase